MFMFVKYMTICISYSLFLSLSLPLSLYLYLSLSLCVRARARVYAVVDDDVDVCRWPPPFPLSVRAVVRIQVEDVQVCVAWACNNVIVL